VTDPNELLNQVLDSGFDPRRRPWLHPLERELVLRYLEHKSFQVRTRAQSDAIRDEVLFKLALASGQSAAELTLLNVDDLVATESGALIRRGGLQDRVLLPTPVALELLAYRSWLPKAGHTVETGAPLFPEVDGGRLTTPEIERRWRAALAAAGVTPHWPFSCARLTVATFLFQVSHDDGLVEAHLGVVESDPKAPTDAQLQSALDAMWDL